MVKDALLAKIDMKNADSRGHVIDHKEKALAEASALSGAYLSLLTAGLRFLNVKRLTHHLRHFK